MHEKLRAGWRWASWPGDTPALRDFVAVVTIAQGIVRIIDGPLFLMPVTWLLTQMTYGITQVIVALWLLATRWQRAKAAARLAAAMTAGAYITLAWDVFPTNSVSAITALLFAWVLISEARYNATAVH